MVDTKEYKIIKIINEYNVLINAGTEDGILSSTRFIIKVKGKPVIFDGENYGTLDYIKAELEVKQLYPKMCLCQNNKIIKVRTNTGVLSSIYSGGETIEKIAPLEVATSDVDDEFKYILDHTLKVGDTVEIK